MDKPNQTLIQMLVTEQTCGEACWHAREDICRCSCGGRNHGCLNTKDGSQPSRTRKIKNTMYQLVTIESDNPNECRAATMKPIHTMQYLINRKAIANGLFEHHELNCSAEYCPKPLPSYVKTASEPEIKRWIELANWRERIAKCYWDKPLTLWVRADLLNLVPTNEEVNTELAERNAFDKARRDNLDADFKAELDKIDSETITA